MGTVDHLPVWKADSTPGEWLAEIAAIAYGHPERFGKMVVIMEETVALGRTKQRRYIRNATINEILGIMEIAKSEIISDAAT